VPPVFKQVPFLKKKNTLAAHCMSLYGSEVSVIVCNFHRSVHNKLISIENKLLTMLLFVS